MEIVISLYHLEAAITWMLCLICSQVIALSRELEELRDQLAESERVRKVQQGELEDVMSSKDDVGRNVSSGYYSPNFLWKCLC